METVETTRPVPVPDTRDLRKMIFELLDEPVVCSELPAAEMADDLVATYQGRDGRALALVIVDVGFAAATSAALVKLPPRLVDEARKAGALPDSLVDVFREVANIFSALMNSAKTPHLVLRNVVSIDGLADDERAVLDSTRRIVQKVEIKGYGTGTCTFVCA